MTPQDHLSRTTARVDLAFSALPDAPVVATAPPADPAPVRRVRRRLAAGLQRTAAWVEPAPTAHPAA
jgi:hypothetical protein